MNFRLLINAEDDAPLQCKNLVAERRNRSGILFENEAVSHPLPHDQLEVFLVFIG